MPWIVVRDERSIGVGVFITLCEMPVYFAGPRRIFRFEYRYAGAHSFYTREWSVLVLPALQQ